MGCKELVYELERRAADFEAADAYLVGIGYETGQVGRRTAANNGIESYPLLQEAPPYPILRSLGLWSDSMGMPLMGYVIIDREGRIVAREEALSEAKGAAPRNIDRILAALREVREPAG